MTAPRYRPIRPRDTDRAIRAAAATAGRVVHPGTAVGLSELRQTVRAMPSDAAVDFLLDFIASTRPEANADAVAALVLHGFSLRQARVLMVLRSAVGRVATHDAICLRASMGRDSFGTEMLRVYISAIRGRIRDLGWPVTITAANCLGYKLHVTDPAFRWPDAADGVSAHG